MTQRPTHNLSPFVQALTSSPTLSPVITPVTPASLMFLRYVMHVPASGPLHLLLLLPRMLYAQIATCLSPYSGFFLNIPSSDEPSLTPPSPHPQSPPPHPPIYSGRAQPLKE